MAIQSENISQALFENVKDENQRAEIIRKSLPNGVMNAIGGMAIIRDMATDRTKFDRFIDTRVNELGGTEQAFYQEILNQLRQLLPPEALREVLNLTVPEDQLGRAREAFSLIGNAAIEALGNADQQEVVLPLVNEASQLTNADQIIVFLQNIIGRLNGEGVPVTREILVQVTGNINWSGLDYIQALQVFRFYDQLRATNNPLFPQISETWPVVQRAVEATRGEFVKQRRNEAGRIINEIANNPGNIKKLITFLRGLLNEEYGLTGESITEILNGMNFEANDLNENWTSLADLHSQLSVLIGEGGNFQAYNQLLRRVEQLMKENDNEVLFNISQQVGELEEKKEMAYKAKLGSTKLAPLSVKRWEGQQQELILSMVDKILAEIQRYRMNGNEVFPQVMIVLDLEGKWPNSHIDSLLGKVQEVYGKTQGLDYTTFEGSDFMKKVDSVKNERKFSGLTERLSETSDPGEVVDILQEIFRGFDDFGDRLMIVVPMMGEVFGRLGRSGIREFLNVLKERDLI